MLCCTVFLTLEPTTELMAEMVLSIVHRGDIDSMDGAFGDHPLLHGNYAFGSQF